MNDSLSFLFTSNVFGRERVVSRKDAKAAEQEICSTIEIERVKIMLAVAFAAILQIPSFIPPQMDRSQLSNLSKGIVILLGIVCFAFALAGAAVTAFTWGFVFVLAFSIFIAPRMTLTLPKSRFAISFSDALVFLTFLLYLHVLHTLQFLCSQ